MRTRVFVVAAAVAAALTVARASAGDHEHREDHDGRRSGRHAREGASPRAPDPTYAKECGACHLAYPPRLLPAASWRALLAGLDRHFGEDASLEPEVRAALEAWLVEGAGGGRRAEGAAPSLRITEGAWFRHEHDEVPPDAAARPAIRSLANCAACHPGAERWDFDEDRVKIPAR
jgi:hypothetical protein